jgi:hypothetical protein
MMISQKLMELTSVCSIINQRAGNFLQSIESLGSELLGFRTLSIARYSRN